jgi:hypothetical protein
MRKPQTLFVSLAAGSIVLSTLLAVPSAAQQVEIGSAATVVGKVNISNAKITKPRKIERRQRIAWGDLIDTGKKSQLQILLLDRSTFGIGARSSLRIDRFVYDPNEGRSFFATFFKGAMRFFSGRQDGANSGEIETPAGRIGIRGTALDLLVGKEAEDIAQDEEFVGKVDSDKGEATLVILRGPGAGTAGGLNPGLVEVEGGGKTVVLDQPGLAAYIPRAGAVPIGPFFISNQGLAKVQDELAPEVARAADGGGLLGKLIPAAIGAVALGVLLTGNDDAAPRQPTANNDNNNDTVGGPNSPIP